MLKIIPTALSLSLVLLTAGCSSTPAPEMFVNHFNQATQNSAHSKCMNEHAMFNNRQLMVSPSAVENAWTYCLNQFGIIAPGQDEDETLTTPWE